MTAHAIASGDDWRCPTLHLAEWEGGDAPVIRVTAQGDGPLVLDPGLPHGFALIGADAPRIEGVTIAADDPQAVLVSVSKRAEGLKLAYAAGGPGALHDDWGAPSRTGVTLHRWALPAILPVNGARA
jgi:hypothetical protein